MGSSWSSSNPTPGLINGGCENSKNSSSSMPMGGNCKRQKTQSEDHPHTDRRLIPGLPDEIGLLILARASRSCHPAMKRVSKSWKSTVTGTEIFTLRRHLGVTEQWLYLLLKDKQEDLVWVSLDPLGTWRQLSPMPDVPPRHHHPPPRRSTPVNLLSGVVNALLFFRRRDSSPRIPFFGCSTAESGGFLYVLGGFSGVSATTVVRRYDPRLDEWREVAPMSTPRAYCKTGVVEGLLYAVGGVSRSRNGLTPLQSAEVYDPVADTWTPVASMAFGGAQLAPAGLLTEVLRPIATGMAALRGRLWVAQSMYSWPFFMDVGGEVYDPVSMTWGAMPRGMGDGWPARQAGMKVSVVVEGRLLSLDPVHVAGGEGCRIKAYDFERDSWQVVARKVPVVVDVAGDGESPYLLAAWQRRLHVVTKDVDGHVVVMRAIDGCERDTVDGGFTVVAARSFGRAELVSCQVVEI